MFATLAIAIALNRSSVQNFCNLLEVHSRNLILFWKINYELNVEVAVRHWILIKRHTQTTDSLQLLVVQYFSWSSGYSILFAIKVR